MTNLQTTFARCAAGFLLGAALAMPAASFAQTLITTENGDVQGQINGATREFLGIPYAAPPVGPLRFAPPQAVTPWVTPLDATAYPPGCSQLPVLTNGDVRIENEDCLYLNVWTPDPAPAEPLPVMVWIHGGSNTSGSTADFVPFPDYEGVRLYNGRFLAENRGVVVVTLNYRLNVFGFFGLPELADEYPLWPYAGNQGLLDQRRALRWVRDNIAAFGGDPGNVTLFGESAGSFDVCAHVASTASAGLFHRAISQSGGCSVGVQSAEEAAAAAQTIVEAVGCDTAPDVLACLRAVPLADLLDAGPLVGLSGEGNLGISVDGGFLPQHPRDIFDNERMPRVPWILGANTDEGTLFAIGTPEITEAEYSAELLTSYGAYADEIEAMYPASDFDTPRDALIRVIGDSRLVCSTYDVAVRYARKRQRTFVYNFNRVPPLPFISFLDLGAFHGLEIAYVFGSTEPPTQFDRVLGERMQQFWTSFARRGRPRLDDGERWDRFRQRDWRIQRLDTALTTLNGYNRAQCEFWTSIYESGDF